jgi:Trk K+ transport system NAD-binding subunit
MYGHGGQARETILPSANTPLEAGDVLTVLNEPETVRKQFFDSSLNPD